MSTLYISRLTKLAEEAAQTNEAAFETVSTKLADSLQGGGLVHLYGSGHSVLPCQETFPRYGSYVGFNPLTDPRVMWHNVLGAGGVRELEQREHRRLLLRRPLALARLFGALAAFVRKKREGD